MIQDPKVRNWLAENESNEIIGYIGCYKDNDEKKGGFGIYVLPKYQGYGVGKALMDKGLEWLSDTEHISIGVYKFNEKAIEWYKKLGFQFTGESEDFYIGDFVGKGWILNMKR